MEGGQDEVGLMWLSGDDTEYEKRWTGGPLLVRHRKP
jgi:hypothetical protein